MGAKKNVSLTGSLEDGEAMWTTAKIREAVIKLKQNDISSFRYRNTCKMIANESSKLGQSFGEIPVLGDFRYACIA